MGEQQKFGDENHGRVPVVDWMVIIAVLLCFGACTYGMVTDQPG